MSLWCAQWLSDVINFSPAKAASVGYVRTPLCSDFCSYIVVVARIAYSAARSVHRCWLTVCLSDVAHVLSCHLLYGAVLGSRYYGFCKHYCKFVCLSKPLLDLLSRSVLFALEAHPISVPCCLPVALAVLQGHSLQPMQSTSAKTSFT